MSDEIYFVDTTMRDGHASLWAEGMRTGMMLPAASRLASAGVVAAEIIASSHFKKCVRELWEDPWERIREVSANMRGVHVAAMSGRVSTFDIDPIAIRRLWLERLAANGIQRVQLMHASNDMNHLLPEEVRFAHEAGLKVVVALVYSLSPKHTDEHYAQKTRDAVALQPDAIYLKDPGGLLTPDRIRTLVPVIMENVGTIPLELHSHCTTGLAPLCYLEAVRLGIRTIHTAMPPLADGSSQPSVFNVAHNLRLLGYRPAINEDALAPVSSHFRAIAEHEGLPVGAPVEYDYAQYVHQVPGGVISNLKHQLAQMRLGDRLTEALDEIVQVRQDLGYPIMVTPFSQFVASQAAINLLLGERYKQVTDEIIKYALGHWGKDASDGVDPNVKDRILASPRARQLAAWQPAEPTIAEIRQKMDGSGISDDELLLRYLMRGDEEIRAMRAAPRRRDYSSLLSSSARSLVSLVQELATHEGLGNISVQKGQVSIRLTSAG